MLYIEKLQTENPRVFWQQLRRLGPNKRNSIPMEIYNESNQIIYDTNLVLNKWKTDFENLYADNTKETKDLSDIIKNINYHIALIENNMIDPLYESNKKLNSIISFHEVESAVMKTKNFKSAGIDQIPYDVLKNNVTISALHKFFNLVFDYSIVPSLWLKSLILPIPKSGSDDPCDPMNYRGISLICCIAKIYGSILNKRLLTYLDANQLLVEEQNGFRGQRSCNEHIFSLFSILRNRLNTGQDTFAAFIDLRKAFDSVKRNLLLYKICNYGIDGKFYFSIKALYQNTTASVKLNNYITDWFETPNGVKQGDTLSPTLFSIFINDLAKEIKELKCGIAIGLENMYVCSLLYADDIVIIAPTEENLQKMLNVLVNWCKNWKLEVNHSKSNIMHFRNARKQISGYKFHLDTVPLTNVCRYKYLGVYFDENLKFNYHEEQMSASANRALGSIINKYKSNKYLPFHVYSKLFNSCVVPIIDYGSLVYCGSKRPLLERVQTTAARIFLGVTKYAPHFAIQGDIGWMTCKYRLKLNNIRFWNHLIRLNENRLCKIIMRWDYSISYNNWSSYVQEIFNLCQNTQHYDNLTEYDLVNCSDKLLLDMTLNWKENLLAKPKLRIYRQLKETINTELYVSLNLTSKERSMIAHLRLGVLPLAIETGRYQNKKINDRKCFHCDDAIEDEFHFLFHCSLYIDERNKLMSCTNLDKTTANDALKFSILCKQAPRATAKYINSCFSKRNELVYV